MKWEIMLLFLCIFLTIFILWCYYMTKGGNDMICMVCGAQIPNGAPNCPGCGTNVQSMQRVQPVRPMQQGQQVQQAKPVQPKQKAQASMQASAMFWLRAGVMPVQWNQVAPSKIFSQSNSSGLAVAMAESARS